MTGRSVIAFVVAAVLLSGCTKAEAACGKPFAEPIDQNSSVHILPGMPELPYKTNPPTSGAHRVAEIKGGVSLEKIDKPTQVHILESGRVLIQYKGLKASQWAALNRLAGEMVIVAPNDSLDTSVVATAWLFKLECARVDAGALREFIDAHAEKAPSH